MSDPTIPGQLDTIIGQLGTVHDRLADGDARMNEADKARGQMNDKLDVHGLMLHDLSLKQDEQDKNLTAARAEISDTNGKIDKLIVAVAENTAITNVVKDGFTTARVGKKVLIWVASVAGSLSTIAGVVWATIKAVGHH